MVIKGLRELSQKLLWKWWGRKRKLYVIYPHASRCPWKGCGEAIRTSEEEGRSGSGPRVLFSSWSLGPGAVQLLLRTHMEHAHRGPSQSYFFFKRGSFYKSFAINSCFAFPLKVRSFFYCITWFNSINNIVL